MLIEPNVKNLWKAIHILFVFKLNTVVNIHNWMEDMAFEVDQLRPVRWKVTILGMGNEDHDDNLIQDEDEHSK